MTSTELPKPIGDSPHAVGNRVARVAWAFAWTLLFRPSPRNFHRWRNWLLRLFGAKLSPTARVYPRARLWAPWNLAMADYSCIGDDADVYNVARVTIGAYSTVSQYCYLCTASHDHTVAEFPLVTKPITVGTRCWVAADVFVGPGVTIGDGTVVGARSSVFGDLPEWVIAVGTPAKAAGPRKLAAMDGGAAAPVAAGARPVSGRTDGQQAMIDVMIIAYNEALNLPHCLEALRGWANRVFVIDSGSDDGTPEIARSSGAEVVHHDWPGYARQKNWGLDNLPFESPWLLLLDADELVTPELRGRLAEIAARPPGEVKPNGFFINRLTIFLGRPIRHCGFFPSWNLRFFKRGTGRYEDRAVHEHVVIDDPVGYIREPMIHDDRRGLEHYVAKHNRYSTLEARSLWFEMTGTDADRALANLSPAARRRRWLKLHVLPRVPAAWLGRFLYMYVLRLGFLDGAAGLEFCKFISFYDYLVAMKLRALRRDAKRGVRVFPTESERSALAVAEGREQVLDTKPAPPPPAVNVERAEPADGAGDEPVSTVEPLPEARPAAGASGRFDVREPRAPVSVIILTLNEEINIADCLASCAWCDDVHVVDSGSGDRTVEIAGSLGAAVSRHAFESFGRQFNWAVENLPLRHDWVFNLAADERFTPGLVEDMRRLVTASPDEAGFYVPNKLMFMGRWLKRSGGYPTYQMRLFHQQRMRFRDHGHGEREHTDGVVGTLDTPYLHFAFSKGLTDWFAKHNRYSTLEALQVLERAGEPWSPRHLFSRHRVDRRRAWKEFSYKLPLRPFLRWFFILFVAGGILEGRAGRTYARMLSIYEQMITLKLRRMRREARLVPGTPPAAAGAATRQAGDDGAATAAPEPAESR